MTSDEMNDDEIVPDADELPDKCLISRTVHVQRPKSTKVESGVIFITRKSN